MEEVRKRLEARKKELLKLKKEKIKALKNVPEGTLRICPHGKGVQYYRRTDPKDVNGNYISKNDLSMIQKLAQKDYDQKIIRAIEQELQVISRFLSGYPNRSVEEIYEALHPERKKLVFPVCETEETYIRNWEEKEYEKKEFWEAMPQLYTAKGERVRSKSEVIIADALARESIPYRYECSLYLDGLGIVYPDFTVLNVRLRKEMYWEHLGMMDDAEYVENAIQRIAVYEQNGIFPGEQLILTYETRANPLNQKLVQQLIDRYLK